MYPRAFISASIGISCRIVGSLMENEMNERNDETRQQPPEQSQSEREQRKRGSYYYDDATGYEIYDPAKDDEDEEDDDELKTVRSQLSVVSRQLFVVIG
jgi:hypothetical protein